MGFNSPSVTMLPSPSPSPHTPRRGEKAKQPVCLLTGHCRALHEANPRLVEALLAVLRRQLQNELAELGNEAQEQLEMAVSKQCRKEDTSVSLQMLVAQELGGELPVWNLFGEMGTFKEIEVWELRKCQERKIRSQRNLIMAQSPGALIDPGQDVISNAIKVNHTSRNFLRWREDNCNIIDAMLKAFDKYEVDGLNEEELRMAALCRQLALKNKEIAQILEKGYRVADSESRQEWPQFKEERSSHYLSYPARFQAAESEWEFHVCYRQFLIDMAIVTSKFEIQLLEKRKIFLQARETFFRQNMDQLRNPVSESVLWCPPLYGEHGFIHAMSTIWTSIRDADVNCRTGEDVAVMDVASWKQFRETVSQCAR